MLMVSDVIEVARGDASPAEVTSRTPARFHRDLSRVPVIVWNVCRHCNMSCPHCYAAASSKPSRDDLSTEEGLALISELASVGIQHLILSGGEPLQRGDLTELVAAASGAGLSVHLSSNGVLLDATRARELAAAGLSYCGISIDGLASFNDSYRGFAGGFARASRGLISAKSAGLRTGLRITVTRRNMTQVEPLMAHAHSLGVDRFYLSHLVYAGRGFRLSGEDLSPAETRGLLSRTFAEAARLLAIEGAPRVVTGGNDSDGPALLVWIEERLGCVASARARLVLAARGGNSAGESVLNIDHRGRVHPDQFWRGATLGDVRRDSFRTILEHPLRAKLARREELLRGRCGSCAYLDVCRGSHRERALAVGGELWDPDPACVMRDGEIAAPASRPWAAPV